jgi:hypothetical protein
VVSQYPLVANSAWFDDLVGQQVEAIAADLRRTLSRRPKNAARGKNLMPWRWRF